MDKKKVADIARKQREVSKRGLSAQYENNEACQSFYNADQMTYNDSVQFMDTFGQRKRATVNFNKVQQNVDAVVGFMAQNRRQAKYIARVNQNQGQQLYSKNMNALYDFHRENCNADQLETQQDTDMMVQGYGVIDTDLSYIIGNYTLMPNGEILKARVTKTAYWDPNAETVNVLDARWAGYYTDYDMMDALSLFQDSKEEDFEAVGAENPSDTGYTFNPLGGIYDKIKMLDSVEWASKEQDMVRVYNHQWFEYETFYKAANPLYTVADPLDAMFIKMKLDVVAESIKLPGDTLNEDVFKFDPLAETLVFDEKTKRMLVKELGEMIKPVSFKRKVFYTAVLSGDHVFTWFKSVSQQGFSIKFKTGTWNASRKIWMGMVNAMMEPQKYWNKAFTELMFTIAANSKGGVYVEDDAVEDVAVFETKYAKTDGVIMVNPGALGSGKIQDKARPSLPTGLEAILTFAEQNISQNGVDPAFLGDIGKADQSGLLYKRRIRQVISKFARYFDAITLYQKEDARLHGDLIPVWVENNRGATIRITGEDGAEEFFTICEDMLAPEYDVSIQEASQSMDEKMETSQTLATQANNLFAVNQVDAGKAFLAEALQYTNLDGDARNRLAESLKTQAVDPQQFQMMQQQLQQMQAFIQSGEVQKTQSETQYNLARAAKTVKDAGVSEVQVPKVQAETIRTMAEANRIGVESQVSVFNATKPEMRA